MNRLFATILVITFLLSAPVYRASTHKSTKEVKEGTALIYKAYIYYNRDLFLQAAQVFESAIKNESTDTQALYYLTTIEYKLLEMSLSKGNEDLFDLYYEKAVEHAEKISAKGEFSCEGKTLLAAIYMMKIASSPMSAVTLSGKIHGLLDEAQVVNAKYPGSYVVRGIMKYNTPALFGGSTEDAMKNFSQALSLFERAETKDSTLKDWGYLEALAWSGRAQTELENYDAALFTYTKALRIEPEFMWVKRNLLPNLQKIMASN